MPTSWVRRYAELIDRRRHLFLAASLIVVAVGGALSLGMPVLTDTSMLLPPTAQSVVDLRQIEQRARATGTLLVLVEAKDPASRAAAAADVRARLARLPRELVSDVVEDDLGARRWFWDQRFLFAPLADLEAARDGLRRRIERAKLEMNPAYVSFEDEGTAAEDPEERRLDDLERTWDEAEQQAKEPPGLISKDRLTQQFIVRSPIVSSEVETGRQLDDAVLAIATGVQARHPGVRVGVTGDIHVGTLEQRAILGGMALATVITVIGVIAAMLAFFRSLAGVAAVLASLSAGVIATFGATRLMVGHLNSVSAFLAAIVVGVGIDFGIIFLGRYLEEMRAGRQGVDALARAIAGSAPGTFTAACAVGVAYASLTVTQFRGFHEFGVIGGMGMALCWIAAYTTLPALIAVLARSGLLRAGREPRIGRLLDRLQRGGRPRAILWASVLITTVAGVLSWRYLASHPFDHDLENLRSTSAAARRAREWTRRSNREFGGGLSGQAAVAAPSRDAARTVVAILRASDASIPEDRRRFGRITSLDNLIPVDQAPKLAVLAEIRHLLDDKALDALDPAERVRLMRFRPPDDLRPVSDADVPERLAGMFTEKDGSRGRIVYLSFGRGVRFYDARSLEDFVDNIRRLSLPADVHIGGTAFIFTDITRAVERDGTRATLAAIVGVALFVLVLVGANRHALVTIACVVTGTLIMIAGASLLGIRINFLDFAALPLTLGISVDYSVNIVMRHRSERGEPGARRALGATGGAVMLCSFTTIVGYGSLALSENAGIRSFGVAATLGEITCLLTALTLGPALLWAIDRGRPAEPAS